MRKPQSKSRLRRNEELFHRFKAELDDLMDGISDQLERLENAVPPLLLASVPREEMPVANERAELECRKRIDAAIRHWLVHKQFLPLRASDEFWLGARFEHAYWLARCILTPDRDKCCRYIPMKDCRLLSGFREWLLIQTWAEVGHERFLSDMLPP